MPRSRNRQKPVNSSGLAGIRVLLTGASGSIGSEVARQLAARGARLALTARNESKMRSVADEIEAAGRESPALLPADLGQPGNARRVAEEASAALGGIDVLVNNAGVTMQALSWVAGDGAQAREVFETNLWSPLALVAAVAPGMLERGRGTIVNISSMAGLSPIPRLSVYSSSRASLGMSSEVMDMELGPRGVRVVEVVFGPIDTPTARENRVLGGGGMQKGRAMGGLVPAAETIVGAVEGDAHGVIFYPGMMRVSQSLPGLMRLISRRSAGKADLQDTTIQFGPSSGSGKTAT